MSDLPIPSSCHPRNSFPAPKLRLENNACLSKLASGRNLPFAPLLFVATRPVLTCPSLNSTRQTNKQAREPASKQTEQANNVEFPGQNQPSPSKKTKKNTTLPDRPIRHHRLSRHQPPPSPPSPPRSAPLRPAARSRGAARCPAPGASSSAAARPRPAEAPTSRVDSRGSEGVGLGARWSGGGGSGGVNWFQNLKTQPGPPIFARKRSFLVSCCLKTLPGPPSF